jgi:hypothetical protein
MKIKEIILELQKIPEENDIYFHIPDFDDTLVIKIDKVNISEYEEDLKDGETVVIINKDSL